MFVGQTAIIEHLQEQIPHIRMRLLHFIQQNHVIRPATHRFRQLAAFFVAHVAWRRADQSRHGVLLHVLRHIDPHDVLLIVEQLQRQLLRQLGFAHAGGAQEEEAARRLSFARKSRARAKNGVADRFNSCGLTDDLLAEPLRQLDQAIAVGSAEAIHRNARPVAHHVANIVRSHFFLEHSRVLLLLDRLFLSLNRFF